MKKKVNKEFIATYYGVEIFFEDLSEISTILGIQKKEILDCMSGYKRHKTGYTFRRNRVA